MNPGMVPDIHPCSTTSERTLRLMYVGMSASTQELLLSTATQHSFGALYLFQPDTYRKGHGVREPADLVWLCRRTAFLINMQAGASTFESQAAHNMKQLRGWLRAWAGGKALLGSNAWRTFEIPYDEIEQIVLLSIVDGGDAAAEFDWDELARCQMLAGPKAVAAASLPQRLLLDLVKRGGTALDLADYILHLSTLPRVSEEVAMMMLSEQHFDAVHRIRTVMGSAEDRDDELDTKVSQGIVQQLRAHAGIKEGEMTDGIYDGISVFNDLDWEESARLIFSISDVTKMVRDVPIGEYGPQFVATTHAFDNYIFVLAAGDIGKAEGVPDNYATLLESVKEQEPTIITNMMAGRPTVEFYTQVLGLTPQTRRSSVSMTLAQVSRDLRGSAYQGHGYDSLSNTPMN